MIDTVAIKHYRARPPTEEHLYSLGWQPRYDALSGKLCAYVHNAPKGSVEPRLTLLRTPKMDWHLKAEASLPKLLRRANIPLLDESEIASSLQLLAASVERRSGVRFDLDSSLVSRVDFARDIQVGESEIVPTIAKLMRVQIPRYDHTQYSDTSAVFTSVGKSKSKRISVYDKFAEVIGRDGSEEERSKACGIIRVEVKLKTKAIAYLSQVKQLGVLGRETRYILTRKVADFVLQDTLEKLQFGAIDSNSDEAIERLLAHYGARRAKSLLGFLELRRRYGEGLYKREGLNFPRGAYFRDLADCRRAGVLP